MRLPRFFTPSKRGNWLFSVNESARTHNYIRWSNPLGIYLFLGVLSASLSLFAVYIYQHLAEVIFILRQATLVGIFASIGIASTISFIIFYPRSYTHAFYENYIKVHRTYNKGMFVWVPVESIETLRLKKMSHTVEACVIAKIIFKQFRPKFLGRPWSICFGINDERDIEKIGSWAREHGISITEETSPNRNS